MRHWIHLGSLIAAAAGGWFAAGGFLADPADSMRAHAAPVAAETTPHLATLDSLESQPRDSEREGQNSDRAREAPDAGIASSVDDQPWRTDETRGRRLTPEQIDTAMNIIHELDPDRADRFERLHERDPRAFERALTRHARGITGLVWIKDKNPELYELKLQELRLDKQVKTLARRIRQVEPARRESLAEELRGLVRQQVNINLRVRAEELLLLENHVQSMRDQLRRDSVNFERTVNSRVRQMLDETEPAASRR